MHNNNNGMTVFEILIASLILSIILLGYIQIQMKSLINTEYSNKVNLISSATNDFAGLFSNYLLNENTIEDKEILIDQFKDAGWSDSIYADELTNCNNIDELDNLDFCDKSMMVQYLVKDYKENIKSIVPDSLFAFEDCTATSNICLIISWGGTLANNAICKTASANCIVVEMAR